MLIMRDIMYLKSGEHYYMEKLIITPKEDKTVTMTIRIDKSLQEAYNKLSARSDRSRNELICMALQYALDNMDVKDKE